ncbi:MAG: heme-binding domain-containing protein [Anaerolineales bacterium]|nr:heme-binding domain-containing protein [Anaerolineales bacterium]
MRKILRVRKENRGIFLACIAAIGLTLLLLQLWPTDTSNPPVSSTPDWDRAHTAELAVRACYDCHSHETRWPWYTKVIPAYFLMAYDVQRGRDAFNFSRWEETCCTQAQIEDMAVTVTKNHMPLPYYTVLHPEAMLNDVERGQLVYGLIRTMNAQIEAEAE